MIRFILDVDTNKKYTVVKTQESNCDGYITFLLLQDFFSTVIMLCFGYYHYVSDDLFSAHESIDKRYYRAYLQGDTLLVSRKNSYIVLEDDRRLKENGCKSYI